MITIKHDGCIFCVGCSSVCPVSAIEASGTRMKTFPERCIDCGLCVKACPANVICLYKGVRDPKDLPAAEGKDR
jgi:L-aspartate semialdehyde sulfurtransferase ferredoxin